MSDVVIIDDAISLPLQNELERLCLSAEFPWFFHASSAYQKSDLEKYQFADSFFKNSVDTSMFTHLLYGVNGINSQYFELFKSVAEEIPCVQETTLSRYKLNLTQPDPRCTPITHSIAHVDLSNSIDYKTILYYINDSDGDTVIFNEVWPHYNELTVKQRISPKKGRMIVFNGKQLHAGNNPSSGVRLTANINLIPKGDE